MHTGRQIRMAAAALLIVTGSLRAQLVTGAVVLRDSITPVPSVIVVAIDARGNTVSRALTSRQGQFTLRIPEFGRYQLDVLRIGFRPTRGPTINVIAGSVESVRIVFAAEPISLMAMTVRERETCRVSSDTGLAVARVWEEARKAMLATQLSTDGAPLFAEWIEYDRTLDSTSRLVRKQSVRTSRNPTTHAFRSVPADVLHDKGYVVQDTIGVNYYIPDAEVLLSNAFVAGHCFRLVEPSGERAAQIGVGFVPTRDRRDMREIQGTLWVDRASAELRTLEFSYTNMPDAAEPAHTGGIVQFLRLGDGNWLVSKWSVRMPRLAQKYRTSTIMSASSLVLRAVQVAGGEVNRVTRKDSLVYQAIGPAMSIQVLAPDTIMHVAGAMLSLEGTDYLATGNASGRIFLSPVLDGRYKVSVRTPFMDSLGMPPVEREIQTRMDAHVDTLVLPSARDALVVACPKESIESFEGMLHGTARDGGARPLKQAAVTATWKTNFSIVATGNSDHVSYGEKTIGTLTDNSGYWRLCGIPARIPISVSVVSDSGSDVREARLSDRPFDVVALVAHTSSAALRDIELAVKPAGARARALIELAVTDVRGAPLSGAILEVQIPGSPTRTMVTGFSGRALVPDVAPGTLTVQARHLGFTPGRVSVTVEAGRNTVPIMMSTASTPMLDTMRVVGGRNGRGRFDDFETRRLNHQATLSISREEIVKRNPTEIWQMLTNMSGVTIADKLDKVVAVSRRALQNRFSNEPCFLLVMVDGVMQNKVGDELGVDLRSLPRPDEIHGIEVFNGPAAIPVQYGGIGTNKWCGLIAVWTR